MGSVRQKPSGRWEARYRDPDGRQRGKSFPTKKAAQDFLARTSVEVQRGDYVSPDRGRQPLKPIAEEWLGSLYHLKPTTLVNYTSAMRTHLLPRLGETSIGRIDQRRVRRLITEMLDEGHGPATVRKVVGVLKLTLDLALEYGMIRENPCVGVKLPQMSKQEMHYLTADQVEQLADAMPDAYGLLVRFAAYTGLRSGEIAALRARHVRVDAAKVDVVTAVSEIHGALVEHDPKSYSSRRAVRLPSFLVDLLREQLDGLTPDAPLFESPGGGPLRHKNFYVRIFKPAVFETLPEHLHGVRFHDLRHTCAAFLKMRGVAFGASLGRLCDRR